MDIMPARLQAISKTLDVDRICAGSTLAENVYVPSGALVTKAGTVVTPALLQRLQQMGQPLITIDMVKVYRQAIDDSRLLMKLASAGRVIPAREVETMVEPFLFETGRETNLAALLTQLQSRDDYTFQHTVSIGVIAMILARWLGHTDDDLLQVALSGTLHDIGKAQIPLAILNKPGPLSDMEYARMRRHPELGYQLVKDSREYSEDVKQAIYQHHERHDGRGYPKGVHGPQIHPYARIVAVADVYHAMTSARPYKGKRSPYEVLDHLSKDMGQLDPEIVMVFVQRMITYLSGCSVLLSDGRTGQVVFVDRAQLSLPIVRVGSELLDLREHPELRIIEVTDLHNLVG